MTAAKTGSLDAARTLAVGLMKRGLGGIIFSPGSRNAPLIQAFAPTGLPGGVALDERAAAHHAMGMALALGRPVAVCCTSGTAALNHGPALAEADRSGLPLISLTADRPRGAHGEWQSQTLVQDGLHALHTRAHFTWNPEAPEDAESQLDAMAEALQHGPIHINCPFDEPLYAGSAAGADPTSIASDAPPFRESANEGATPDGPGAAFQGRLKRAAEEGQRILLLGGTQPLVLEPESLATWSSHAVIAGDPTSGLARGVLPVITACDRWLQARQAEGLSWESVRPDVIVTFGAPLLSRKLRAVLSEGGPEHWHIDSSGRAPHAFGTPCTNVPCAVDEGIHLGSEALKKSAFAGDVVRDGLADWRQAWWGPELRLRDAHVAALADAKWSDLKAHECLFRALPTNQVLHLSNSTPVRYAALFSDGSDRVQWSNRGAAGIDGCTSTAVGAALSGQRITLITGELGFLYDSNAFHLQPLPTQVRIAVIHNGGGGIFRWLDGPERTDVGASHFEWQHDTDLRPLCDLHGLIHERVEDEEALRAALKEWWSPAEAPKVLEIVTPREESAAAYFRYMEAVRG
jgi:2-succinyl-5-enolpyruvyl-6-hydroxy-3-cyclohexene-1-carboxylate synthase